MVYFMENPMKIDDLGVVYFMENPIQKWMIWGYTHFRKPPYPSPTNPRKCPICPSLNV